jgi:hypothetical protein
MPEESPEIHHESLAEEAANIMGEARMVIPGVQTIFGFQLVAVFGSEYTQKLSQNQQYLLLASMVLLAWSLALLMAPAAFHRRSRPDILSRKWVKLSSYLLAWGMNLFMVSVVVEAYLIASVMGLNPIASTILTASVLVVFLVFWIIYPKYYVK